MAGLFDNIKKRLGRGKTQDSKDPCTDEYIFKLLEAIIQYDKELLKGRGIQKLSELYGDKEKIVINETPICTKTSSQRKYIEYIKEMVIQLQRLMDENDSVILKLESDRVKAERQSNDCRGHAEKCLVANNQNILKINTILRELDSKNKEVSECENKIKNLRPKIKSVGGIPRFSPQKSKQSLSPRSKF